MLAGAVGLTLWGLRSKVGTPRWQRQLAQTRPLLPLPDAPEWYITSLARLSALYRGPAEWTVADAEELIAMVMLGRTVTVEPDYAQPRTEDGYKLHLSRKVGAVVEARLAWGAPIVPAAVQRIRGVILEGLEHPLPSHRSDSIVVLVESGLAEPPDVRSHILNMQDDPDPKVAAMARLKYGQLMDYIESDRVRGKLPKGW